MHSVVTLSLVFIFSQPIWCATKRWKFNNNVMDPDNWSDGPPPPDCKGLIFPKTIDTATIDNIRTQEILLPYDGSVEIRGSIELTTANQPCIRIKRIDSHSWFDPNAWLNSNMATPDEEQIPCNHDDVLFSGNKSTTYLFGGQRLTVKSIRFAGMLMTNDQWRRFQRSEYGGRQFAGSLSDQIEIAGVGCADPQGCVCHRESDLLPFICDYRQEVAAVVCDNPVKPIGNCHAICGAVITGIPRSDFQMAKLKGQLAKQETVDVYVSRVRQNNGSVVQIVFAEKLYEEKSTRLARDFLAKIAKDMAGFQLQGAILAASGPPFSPARAHSLFSIVFGTLAGVSMAFAFIYAYYMGPLGKYNIRFFRLNFSGFSRQNLTPVVFSRFVDRDDGQISIAGSVLELVDAFDNPMFEQMETVMRGDVADGDENASILSKSESQYANPVYGATSCDDPLKGDANAATSNDTALN